MAAGPPRAALAGACLFILAAGAASAAPFPEIDRLYLHRHEAGNLERSNALLEAALKEDPEDGAALWRLCRGRVRAGERMAKASEKSALFEEARRLCERASALGPEDPEAHFWTGIAMGRQGQVRGVMRSLFLVGPIKKRMRRVLELDPRHGGAHHVLGEMLRQIPAFAGGSKRKAVRELEQALRLEPTRGSHHVALARAYLETGEKEKARKTLESLFSVKEPADPAEHAEDLAEARRALEAL